MIKSSNKEINSKIAEIFYEMADILEIQNVKWKPQAYRIAAQTLESLGESVEDIYLLGGIKELEELPGIGEALAKKIIQYIENGKIEEHEKLKKSIPSGIYEMMKIPGIGGKKASLFYNELGIKNIKELEEAARKNKLQGLPGFKQKAEEKILEGIEIMKGKKGRIPLEEAEKIAKNIITELKKLKEVSEAVPAGSLRRKKSTIGDIDIVIKTEKPEQVLKKFVKMKFVKKVLGIGKEKAIVITQHGIQADARVFTEEEFGAGLLYFTGDKGHNIWLRKIAIKKGWKLNEYGLFDKNGKRIAGRSEEEI
ncbi:MAG: nucleotidyltransferase domain-containing protein, partial [Candidatus Pacearchaeota archaeon]